MGVSAHIITTLHVDITSIVVRYIIYRGNATKLKKCVGKRFFARTLSHGVTEVDEPYEDNT